MIVNATFIIDDYHPFEYNDCVFPTKYLFWLYLIN